MLFEAIDFVALAKGMSAPHKKVNAPILILFMIIIGSLVYGKIFTLLSERPLMRKTWPAKFPRRRKTARGADSEVDPENRTSG